MVARLKTALVSGTAPRILAVPVDVATGLDRVAIPLLGAAARILPTPAGFAVKPNPSTLATLSEVSGHARNLWSLFPAGYADTSDSGGSWFQSVSFPHTHDGANSASPCTFHFHFDGRAFEVLFAGSGPSAVLLTDGRHATPSAITRTWSGGAEGTTMLGTDTFVRFDFGTAAPRRIALHCASTLGPRAIAVGPSDTLAPWDRRSEASLAALTDSYGASLSTRWAFNAIMFEAAMRLGIPNVDVDPIGGTGYAPNDVVTSPELTFEARLPTMTRHPVDLLLFAGGVNDNNWLALPPYATGEEARRGFEAAVHRTFAAARAALPDAVIVALAPWQPNAAFFPAASAAKADTLRNELSRITGPWVFVDNLRGGWVASSGALGQSPGSGWQTGTGTVASPRGDGNGDLYISADGTHPSPAGAAWLGERLAESLRAAIATL